MRWMKDGFSNWAPKWEKDEHLVVIPPKGKKQEIGAFLEKATPALVSRHHYLTVHAGFWEGTTRPFLCCEWQAEGNHALERRWLLNHVVKVLKTRTEMKKLTVYLPGPVTAEQVVMAEDLFCQYQDAFYKDSKLERFQILTDGDCLEDAHHEARWTGHLAQRQWINENPDTRTSLAIAEDLASFAREHGTTMKVLDRAELEKENLRLLLAVGQASERSPSRLIVTQYAGKNKALKPLMLIGKGVTFDTGGINLKSHENLVNTMKNDMGGAATVAQLFMALVKAGYERPVVCIIPTCENLIGENALKPGTIIKTRSGKSVFIEHTDAEGRLILSDAITYGHDNFQPALTITMATLTTACLRQFSHFYTAVHFANDKVEQSLRAVGDTWGERFTFWPEFLPFLAGNHTKSSDLTNLGRLPDHATGGAGSNIAGHFLKQFAKHPMIHCDIFSSTWNWGGDYPGSPYGATGAPFNAIFQWIRAEKDLWGY